MNDLPHLLKSNFERYLNKVVDQTRRNTLLNLKRAKKLQLNYKLGDFLNTLDKESSLFFLEKDFKDWSEFQNPDKNDAVQDLQEPEAPNLPYLNPALIEGKSAKLTTLFDDIRLSTARDKSDYGIDSLFITLGTLGWSDSRFEEKDYEAPILLIPASMHRKRENGYRWTISLDTENTLINPALQVILENQYGTPNITMALCLEDVENSEGSISLLTLFKGVSDKIEKVLKPKSDIKFRVNEKLTLSKHRFQNYHIYEDLKSHQDAILESDLVQGMLADEDLSERFPVLVAQSERDSLSCEEDFSVLDADISQQQVISKVSQGQSLIVQGPPGTGKSQTITNIISNLVARGKKVLFVCDKKVALQVVERNLEKAGISDVVLPLYNGADDKKQLAKTIVETFSEQQKKKRTSDDVPLKARRKYVDALYKYKDFLESKISETDFKVKEILFNLDTKKLLEATKNDQICFKDTFDKEGLEILKTRFSSAKESLEASHHIYKQFGERKAAQEYVNETDTSIMREDFSKHQKLLHEISEQLPASTIKMSPINLVSLIEQISTDQDALSVLQNSFNGELEWSQVRTVLSSCTDSLNALSDILKWNEWKKLEEQVVQVSSSTLQILEGYISETATPMLLSEMYHAYLNIDAGKDMMADVRDFSVESLKTLFELSKRESELGVSSEVAVSKEDTKRIQMLIRELMVTAGKMEEIEAKLLQKHVDLKIVLSDQNELVEEVANTRVLLPFGNKFSKVKELASSLSMSAMEKFSFGEIRELSKLFQTYLLLRATRVNLVKAIGADRFLMIGTIELKECATHLDKVLLFCETSHVSWDKWKQLSRKASTFLKKDIDLIASINKLNDLKGHFLPEELKGLDEVHFALQSKELLLRVFEENLKGLQSFPTDASMEELRILTLKNEEYYSRTHELLESFADESISVDINALEVIALAIENLTDLIQINPDTDVSINLSDFNNLTKLDPNIVKSLNALSEFCDNYIGTSQLWSVERIGELLKTALNDWDTFIEYCEYSEFRLWTSNNHTLHIVDYLESEDVSDWGLFAQSAACYSWIGRQTYFDKTGFEILEKISGEAMGDLVDRFQNSDRDSILCNSDRLLSKYRESLNLVTIPTLLKRESNKKRQLKPVNFLVKEAGSTMQTIKPVWMMNPSSVSMHFAGKRLPFDCVIFDEASQLRLEHALSALALAPQVVVLGDQHQLPPTSFFEAVDGDHEDETDDYQYGDLISASKTVLGITHESTLRYHYRSRYEELVAFSNSFVYDNALITFPNPVTNDPIALHYVKDGICVEGQNDIEAQAVVSACKKIVDNPEFANKSIGVIALSKRQENAIREAFHAFISENLDYELRFGEEVDDTVEPFFIKNLENVQGDERDIIILSTGYGRGTDGNIYQRFGPINTAQGYRRLNVAITRAREKMACVTSLRSVDITEGTNRGRQMLKQFLNYCEHGKDVLNTQAVGSDGIEDSAFEISVRQALESRGLALDAQVGVSGYRIDLAVRDEKENRYLLGIECDGSVYHSSYSARVNDRIRESHLQNLGWKIYRIWSYDWANHREDVIEEILALVQV